MNQAKIKVSSEMMVSLLKHSMECGTQDAAINLAIEWIKLAQVEFDRLYKTPNADEEPEEIVPVPLPQIEFGNVRKAAEKE